MDRYINPAHFKISRPIRRPNMRDLQLQTPQRDPTSANRRLKSTSELNRNLRKVTKKSLNPAFKAISEEDSAVFESLEEFSEVSDDNPFGESPENFIAPIKPADTCPSETVVISDLSSPSSLSSSVMTSVKQAAINPSGAQSSNPEIDFFKKIECIEAELVIKHLTEARIEVLKSKDMGPSKKLLVALINIIIEEFHGGLCDKKAWLDKLLSNNTNLVLLSFMIGIFAMFMSRVFSSGAREFRTGLAPT